MQHTNTANQYATRSKGPVDEHSSGSRKRRRDTDSRSSDHSAEELVTKKQKTGKKYIGNIFKNNISNYL